MDDNSWISEIIEQYHSHRRTCERAAGQVSDESFFKSIESTHSSIGMLMKHLGGNNSSRWRNFLSSDGEKVDRDRESEFVTVGETRETIMQAWEKGWQTALDSLQALEPEDLNKTITIRGEPIPVRKAILRNLAHLIYHTGQIVLIARCILGEKWEFLSIPPGKSDEYNMTMREKFGEWRG